MLQKLTVKNYAIIDHIEISFSDQLNIITGETGAGKSILVGALSLVLGDRADSKVLFKQQEKCVVEAVFNVSNYGLKNFFEENDLDFDETAVIRREINAQGKSRAFVNDTPVTLGVVKALGAQLVNLHSQHETLELSTATFQLQLVDAVAKNEDSLKAYQSVYQRYKKQQTELERLKADLLQTTGDLDYLSYQFRELDEAGLDNEDHELLEQELKTLENAEEIKAGISKVQHLLTDDSSGAVSVLNEAAYQLQLLQKYSPAVGQLAARLESVLIELQDIADEAERTGDDTVYDQERIQLLTDRLNAVNKLLAKHKAINASELIAIRDDLKARIESATNAEVKIQELSTALEKERKELEQKSGALTKTRKAVLTKIEKEVASKLSYVGMPDSKLAIELEPIAFEKLNVFGGDKIRFLFSANKGRQPEELRHVASGGELSRLMLVLKSLIADNTALPTLIFDEIDTGISGEVAFKVGQVMEQLGEAHQVISITHLPQIASKGKSHFWVHKAQQGGNTVTRIKQLTEEERVGEIAKMLGGDKITEAAMVNAKELLNVLM